MTFQMRRVEYFHASVADEPSEACGLLNQLAELGVDLLAFSAVPIGPRSTQLTLFPADAPQLQQVARNAGLVLVGPHPALLVQGDDELGALARIHARLDQAGVDVYATSGVADGRGGYGYLVYVRPESLEQAASALGI